MNFLEALQEIKNGNRVARRGWAGKGMFLYLTSGTEIPVTQLKNETLKNLFGIGVNIEGDATVKIRSHIDLKSADGSIVIGWCPSQTDMLEEDWYLVVF